MLLAGFYSWVENEKPRAAARLPNSPHVYTQVVIGLPFLLGSEMLLDFPKLRGDPRGVGEEGGTPPTPPIPLNGLPFACCPLWSFPQAATTQGRGAHPRFPARAPRPHLGLDDTHPLGARLSWTARGFKLKFQLVPSPAHHSPSGLCN
jgi:hypothetical protein